MAITVESLLNLAFAQDGYIEKASANNEDSLTENAGSKNFTKFGRDLARAIGNPYSDGVAWCDQFVDWLFFKLGGKQAIIDNLYGYSAYTPTSANYFKQNNAWYTGNSPKPGYQIFFKNSQRICHTGLVWKCENGYVYTIEGNTSAAKGVVANGGMIRKKSYATNYSKIAGYGIPKCVKEAETNPVNTNPTTKPVTVNKKELIKSVQTYINSNYAQDLIKKRILTAKLKVDGDYGKLTRHALLAKWKLLANAKFKAGLTAKNTLFGDSCKNVSAKCILKKGSTGDFVRVAQLLLKAFGYYSGSIDGKFGPNTCQAAYAYCIAKSLIVKSVDQVEVNQQVWYSLFN